MDIVPKENIIMNYTLYLCFWLSLLLIGITFFIIWRRKNAPKIIKPAPVVKEGSPLFDMYAQQGAQETIHAQIESTSMNFSTSRSIIAGALLILPGIIIILFCLQTLYTVFSGGFSMADMSLITTFMMLAIFVGIIYTIGGLFAIERVHYKFVLFSAALSIAGLNVLGIIALVILLTVEDEFKN